MTDIQSSTTNSQPKASNTKKKFNFPTKLPNSAYTLISQSISVQPTPTQCAATYNPLHSTNSASAHIPSPMNSPELTTFQSVPAQIKQYVVETSQHLLVFIIQLAIAMRLLH